MKKVFLSILILIIILCCKKVEKVGFAVQQKKCYDLSFYQTISHSNEITIKLYDTIALEGKSGSGDYETKKTYNTIDEKQIESFREIFRNAKKTEYCCCPVSVYSIAFLKDNKELDLFYVDTNEFRHHIRIYYPGYQYSYIIDKQKWKNYLEKIEN